MPVHSERWADRWYVVDDKGKKHGEHSTHEKAKKQVTAMNVAMGHVPGVTPDRQKKTA